MKVETSEQFKPVKLTLETPVEVQAVYHMLRHAYITEAAGIHGHGHYRLLEPFVNASEFRQFDDALIAKFRKT